MHVRNAITIRMRYVWERIFFSITEQKISVLKIIRIRVADSFVLSEVYIYKNNYHKHTMVLGEMNSL